MDAASPPEAQHRPTSAMNSRAMKRIATVGLVVLVALEPHLRQDKL
jgi:hypothetical protein